MALYRNFQTQEEIDEQYDIESQLDMARYGAWMQKRSEAARQDLTCRPSVQYGPTLDEFVDVFPSSTPGSPVLVFIHGGWWRSLSSTDFHYVARGPVSADVTVVMVNYSLCPKVSIAEITRQSRAAVAWTHRNIEQYNGDPNNIFVSGHSAGGHQVGMLAVTDWVGEYGLPADVVRGGVPISGLFDLRPFYYSWLQPQLLLNHDIIQRQSPLFHVEGLANYIPLLITLGGDESEDFHRQSDTFGQAWEAAGGRSETFDQPGRDHISAISGLEDVNSALCQAVLSFIDAHKGL